MKKYRKTALIEAEQWNPVLRGRHYAPIPPVPHHKLVERLTWWELLAGKPANWYIRTLEGDMKISPGDWVACDGDDAYWPIKPDKFAATYEEVSE